MRWTIRSAVSAPAVSASASSSSRENSASSSPLLPMAAPTRMAVSRSSPSRATRLSVSEDSPQTLDALFEALVGQGQGEADEPLSGRAVAVPGDRDDPGLLEQLGRE